MVAVNDAPVDGDEADDVTEDTTLIVPAATGLLANATDVDGGALSITGYTIDGIAGTAAVGAPVAIAGVGSITLNADGSYAFAPEPRLRRRHSRHHLHRDRRKRRHRYVDADADHAGRQRRPGRRRRGR